MNIVNNMKLRVKILGAFIVLIIAMIVIGILGINGMGKTNDSNTFIYQNNFLSTTYIQAVNNYISEVQLYTQKIVTAKYAEDLEANIAALTETAGKIDAQMNSYEASITEDEDRESFTKMKSDLVSYRTERAKAIELAQEGKFDEADEYTTSTVNPLVQVVQKDIDTMVAFNLDDAAANVKESGASYSASVTSTAIIIVVVAILAVLLGVWLSGTITTALNAVRGVAEKIADGDLTAMIPQRFLKRKDEIGMLANNVEAMKQGLINTVTGIKGSTDNLGGQVTSTNDTLTVLNERITDTSAATEELSASMEETGASAEEMNATAAEIERAVETVAEKAEEGANRSGEINSRAVEMGRSVNISIEKSNNIFNEIKVTLEKALEDSKAVDEINALADAILGITSQTTLLALNASIEAARAGEAGKGFAVVANEISALADNSKNTVTQIQAITKVVMSAVSALSSSSTNLLNFVANEVMNDYKGMQTSAVSYTDDATYMSDMTSDLSATSQELLASVQVLMRAISEVATAAQEGAKTTTVVAEQTTDISMNASTIVENMKQTQKTSDSLVGLVNKFKLQD